MLHFNMMEDERVDLVNEIENVVIYHSEVIDFLSSKPVYKNYQNDQEYEMHEEIEMVIYRQHLSTCILLYQLWEHQMAHYIRETFFLMYPQCNDCQMVIDYGDSIDFFREKLDFNIERKKYFKKLTELRTLVAYIKHAEGNAAMRFRKMRSDLIIDPMQYQAMSNFTSPLVVEMININMNELIEYKNAIIEFWLDFSKSVKKTISLEAFLTDKSLFPKQ